jgi:hypothetical protein
MSANNTIVYKSRSWLVLQCLKDFGPQQKSQIVGNTEDSTTLISVNTLLRAGYLRQMPDSSIELTLHGSRKLREINDAANPPGDTAGKRTHTTGVMTAVYEAPELRRTCLRPGAYDAFELPSLMSGQRQFRREIRA